MVLIREVTLSKHEGRNMDDILSGSDGVNKIISSQGRGPAVLS